RWDPVLHSEPDRALQADLQRTVYAAGRPQPCPVEATRANHRARDESQARGPLSRSARNGARALASGRPAHADYLGAQFRRREADVTIEQRWPRIERSPSVRKSHLAARRASRAQAAGTRVT